jgi:hypothetical protein
MSLSRQFSATAVAGTAFIARLVVYLLRTRANRPIAARQGEQERQR